VNRELPHDRLAGAGRRGHQHTAAGLQGQARGALEGVQPDLT
jgi:hypothetical protein